MKDLFTPTKSIMKTDQLAVEIKSKRQEVDALLKATENMVKSDETQRSYLSVRRGLSWLGKSLQALGTPNPYPKSTDSKSKVIEERADQSEYTVSIDTLTPIGVVKKFREAIQEFSDWCDVIKSQVPNNSNLTFALTESVVSFTDAKMELGWELNRIHNLPAKDKKVLEEKTMEEIWKSETLKKLTK